MSPRRLYDGPHRPTRRSQSERSHMVFVLRRIFGGARFGGSWGLLVCAVLRGELLSQIFAKVRDSYRQLRIISALRKSGCFGMGWWGFAKREQFEFHVDTLHRVQIPSKRPEPKRAEDA